MDTGRGFYSQYRLKIKFENTCTGEKGKHKNSSEKNVDSASGDFGKWLFL